MSTVHTHAGLVKALRKPGAEILREMTPDQADLLHMAVGVSGEAGELLDAVKKFTIYQKPLDLINVLEEMGDLEFFLEGIRQLTGLSREDALAANIAKLRKRYPKTTFTNADAQARADKEQA